MNEKSKSRATIVLVALALVSSFFLGRAWGFNEAKEAYEPVLEKSLTLIDELQSEIEDLYAYFEGVTPPSKTAGLNA